MMANSQAHPVQRRGGLVPSAVMRALVFLGFWVILAGPGLADLLVGAMAAGAATWTSLRLVPPGAVQISPIAAGRFIVRFLGQSVLAGIDVARRALHPKMPLRPGFVTYPGRLPPGIARDTFCTVASLLPGTLPADAREDGTLIIHCLDINQPVLEQLAIDEQLLARALGSRSLDG